MSVIECPKKPFPLVKATLRPLLSGINFPTVLKSAILPGKCKESLFVATQTGQIYRLFGKQYQKQELWLDISNLVKPLSDEFCIGESVQIPIEVLSDERGLLGMAFHERFHKNGRFFLYYTIPDDRLPEEVMCPVAVGPDPCDPSTLNQEWIDREVAFDHINEIQEWRVCSKTKQIEFVRTLFKIRYPFFNHNSIAMLNYSKELDMLLFSFGDGGFAFDVFNLSQNDNELLGKLYAFDVDKNRKASFIGPAITRVSEIPDELKPLIKIIGKGLRNPVGMIEFDEKKNDCQANDDYKKTEDLLAAKFLAVAGQEVSEPVYGFREYCQPLDKNNRTLLNMGWRGWEGQVSTTIGSECPLSEIVPRTFSYYNDMALVAHEIVTPTFNYFHIDPRPNIPGGVSMGAITQYQGKAITGLDGSVVFCDFGIPNPPNTVNLQGVLYYGKPDTNNLNKSQQFDTVQIDFDFPLQTHGYVALGGDIQNKRLFIGVVGTIFNVTQQNLGFVYEIIPEEEHDEESIVDIV